MSPPDRLKAPDPATIYKEMDVFVARQPIFDRKSRVYAYELLYRSNAVRNEFNGADEDRTTLDVIAGSLLTIGYAVAPVLFSKSQRVAALLKEAGRWR